MIIRYVDQFAESKVFQSLLLASHLHLAVNYAESDGYLQDVQARPEITPRKSGTSKIQDEQYKKCV